MPAMHWSKTARWEWLGGDCGVPSFLLQLLFPPVSGNHPVNGNNPQVNRRCSGRERLVHHSTSRNTFVDRHPALIYLLDGMSLDVLYTVNRKAHLGCNAAFLHYSMIHRSPDFPIIHINFLWKPSSLYLFTSRKLLSSRSVIKSTSDRPSSWSVWLVTSSSRLSVAPLFRLLFPST
ncbi:hypothetical protein Mapa_007696 [Marchantia paleacea]|nr:hypothetical protein Mapa_007696 [Marchantia paleacea]